MKHTLRAALDDRGYHELTPVQSAVLAPELAGRDMLVSAQTGSGKTVGFGLAIAPTVLGEADHFAPAGAPLGLVIAPTRELALQVQRELGWLYAQAGAVLASCVGGMDMRDERRALARGAHLVVATPGRLRDHIMRGTIDLSALRAVVLDEADEMLDLGFREDLEFILAAAPDERQTLLFSATVPRAITHLAKSYQTDAQRVVTGGGSSQHSDIDYRAMQVAPHETDKAVINSLLFYQAPNAIVFANTRAGVNRLTTRLSNRGFKVVCLSGELSQAERTHALQAMRDGRAQVCVATDVAARGIDLPNLDLVVHAELPTNHETLLHRSGRTGRAGRKGVSALIVTPKTRKKAERILRSAKLRADWGAAPSAEEVRAQDEARMLADPAWQDAATPAEQSGADALLQAFAPQQLAVAYLRLRRQAHGAPEEMSAPGTPAPESREEFGPSLWISVSGGRAAGAEPRRLLPMLCKAGGLNRTDIGAIRVQEDQSYVELRAAAMAPFLAALGPDRVVEKGAVVTQLDAAPQIARGPGPARRKGPPKAGHRGQGGGKPYPQGDRPQARDKAYDKPAKGEKAYDKPAKGDKGARPAPSAPPADAPKAPAPKPAPKAASKKEAAAAQKPPSEAPAPRKIPYGASDPSQRVRLRPGKGGDAVLVRHAEGGPQKSADGGHKKGATGSKPKGKTGARTGGSTPPYRGSEGPRPKPGKGAPPPKGKPSSKKNRARAAAAKAARQAKDKG